MPLTPRNLASLAAAVLTSAQGYSVETDAAGGVGGVATKFIAGVPVFNYDLAFSGWTQNDGAFNVQDVVPKNEESWIVVLKPEAQGETIQGLCRHTRRGCKQEGQHPNFPFVALQATEGELAAFLEPIRDVASFVELDMMMSPDPPQEVDHPVEAHSSSDAVLWGLERIGAYRRTTQGLGVNVYVADTGVRADHVDFGGRAVPFVDMFDEELTPTYKCSESTSLLCGGDVHGHGTHCAGTIAGEHFGVAPQAIIHSVKVLSDQGPGSTSGIINAMGLVALLGVKPAVLSMSLGGSRNEAYKGAVDLIVDEGITVVVAAGNDYRDACTKSPAFVPKAITVGATTSTDARSGFSNFGTCVDLWAPGSDIISADGRSLVTAANDRNQTMSGTSMACPHVSGAAALLLGVDPDMQPAEVEAALQANASVNYITDLSADDKNLLLYVAPDGLEPEKPDMPIVWPTDDFWLSCSKVGQSGPIGAYPVCMCANRDDRTDENTTGTYCYDGNTLGCPIGAGLQALDDSPAYENITLTWWYFLWNCTTCQCLPMGGPPKVEAPFTTTATFVIGTTVATVLAGVVCYYVGYMNRPAGKAAGVEMA